MNRYRVLPRFAAFPPLDWSIGVGHHCLPYFAASFSNQLAFANTARNVRERGVHGCRLARSGGRRPVSVLQRVASVATLSERLAYLARSACEQKACGHCAAPSLPGPVLWLARHRLARHLDTDRQHEPVHRSEPRASMVLARCAQGMGGA